jgi:hypothetical protein
MLPLLAITAANVGRNLLQSAAAGPAAQAQPKASEADPAAFQKFLQKAAATPGVQKAAVLASEGIRTTADAQTKMGDYGARIMQDPEVRKAVAGDSGEVEMRFLSGGMVSIKTSDGREKTVTLGGDAKVSAQKAERILKSLGTGASPATSVFATNLAVGPGIRLKPGAGTATILA